MPVPSDNIPHPQPSAEPPVRAESFTQLMQLASGQPIRPGSRVDMMVALPSNVGQPLDLSLQWITSTGSSLEEKERVAPLDHAGGTTTFSLSGQDRPLSRSTTAPSQPGSYDILLTYNGVLLDAVTVKVTR